MLSNPHSPDCARRDEPPSVAAFSSHIDFFCDCHKNSEPEVLSDGTSIAWPAGWNDARAQAWRRANDLARPKSWLKERLAATGEVELVTEDQATAQRAFNARHNKTAEVEFVFWNGEAMEKVKGTVVSLREHERPIRFAVRPTP